MTTLDTIITIISALGGIELIKWVYTRKSKAKVEEAQAEAAKIQADADEYHLLRERIDYLSQEILDKEKRFTEQTEYVRKLNRDLNGKEVEIGNLKAKIERLLAEREMKLCELRGCKDREPQSGY